LNGNSASSAGGGIYNDTGILTFGNSIFNNTGASGANIFDTGASTVTSAGYNLSNNNGGGFLNGFADLVNLDPMLGPLKDNGGPTKTHAPLVNSPAIDQGKRDTIPALTTNVDQRGSTRPVNDAAVTNGANGDASDIGAVEIQSFVHPTDAASWKTHGGAGDFPIALPLPFSSPIGVECRTGVATGDHKVIVTFAGPVNFAPPALMTSGTGNVASSSGNGTNQITLNLTGVTNAQRIVLALPGTNDGTNTADVGIRMGVLLGDVNGDGFVLSGDYTATRQKSGATVDGTTFQFDLNTDGFILSGDYTTARQKSGTQLP
jgi:hypothetical protein